MDKREDNRDRPVAYCLNGDIAIYGSFIKGTNIGIVCTDPVTNRRLIGTFAGVRPALVEVPDKLKVFRPSQIITDPVRDHLSDTVYLNLKHPNATIFNIINMVNEGESIGMDASFCRLMYAMFVGGIASTISKKNLLNKSRRGGWIQVW